MKRILLLLLLLINATAFSQNETHKKVTDQFMIDFNTGDFEHIYQSFSPEMKKSKSKKYFFDVFSKVKKESGNLQQLNLYDWREKPWKSRGVYEGKFEFGTRNVQITTNKQGEIIGLYIKKYAIL